MRTAGMTSKREGKQKGEQAEGYISTSVPTNRHNRHDAEEQVFLQILGQQTQKIQLKALSTGKLMTQTCLCTFEVPMPGGFTQLAESIIFEAFE